MIMVFRIWLCGRKRYAGIDGRTSGDKAASSYDEREY